MNRLFVPLKSEPFEWFKSGKKRWELRGISNNYNHRTVFIGRKVELSRGYSRERIQGRITACLMFDDIKEVPEKIDYKEIIPIAICLNQFYEICKNYISKYSKFIVFKIEMKK